MTAGGCAALSQCPGTLQEHKAFPARQLSQRKALGAPWITPRCQRLGAGTGACEASPGQDIAFPSVRDGLKRSDGKKKKKSLESPRGALGALWTAYSGGKAIYCRTKWEFPQTPNGIPPILVSWLLNLVWMCLVGGLLFCPTSLLPPFSYIAHYLHSLCGIFQFFFFFEHKE